MKTVAAVAALLLCACAHHVECTAHGGPEWHEAVTDHFVLQSDLSAEETAAEANRLERLRAAVRWFFKMPDEGLDLTHVYEVASEDEMREFEKFGTGYSWFDDADSGIVFSSLEQAPARVKGKVSWSRPADLASHQMAHRYAAWALVELPSWLNEGIAEYLATIELLPDRQAKIGLVGNHYGFFSNHRPLTLAELWPLNLRRAEIDDDRRSLEYQSAWAYLHHAQYESSQLQLAETGHVKSNRVVAPWEVHLLRRAMWRGGDTLEAEPRKARMHLEAERADAVAPTPKPWPVARELAIDAQRLKEAALEYPDDSNAQLVQARGLGESSEAVAHLEAAVKLDPKSPNALRELAIRRADDGKLDEANALLDHANAVAGWDPRMALARAQIASAAGDCGVIALNLDRALSMQGDHVHPELVRETERLRTVLANQCKGAAAR